MNITMNIAANNYDNDNDYSVTPPMKREKQAPRRNNNAVKFNTRVAVREAEHIFTNEERHATWYTKDEFYGIAKENYQTMELIRKNKQLQKQFLRTNKQQKANNTNMPQEQNKNNDAITNNNDNDTSFCPRGLETTRMEKIIIVETVRDAVLHTQKVAQSLERTRKPYQEAPTERIARVYKKYNAESKQKALRLAMMDQQAALQ